MANYGYVNKRVFYLNQIRNNKVPIFLINGDNSYLNNCVEILYIFLKRNTILLILFCVFSINSIPKVILHIKL